MQGKEWLSPFFVHQGISAPQVHHRALSSHALREHCSLFLVQSVLNNVCHVLRVSLTTVPYFVMKKITQLGEIVDIIYSTLIYML